MIPLTGKTRISFLIGTPISQVLAPGRLTDMMHDRGEDHILVPMEVTEAKLADTVAVLKAAPNVGAILVTLPHKSEMAKVCARLSRRAMVLGAVNATRRVGDVWEGDNFDGAGMTHAILNGGGKIDGATIHMVGAGPAAISIAASLLDAGAARLTFNDLSQASETRLSGILGPIYGDRIAATPVEAAAGASMIVNASHCGLHAKAGDPLPVPEHCLTGQFVADVITDPLDTPFLIAARRTGGHTVSGGDMLDGQLRLLCDFILGQRSIDD